MTQRRILVTSALPYANGPIHLGHLVEYIQTDVWVRFQRLQGNDCRYFCADDTHGTAIMISAQKNGISEAEWIARVSDEHQRDFAGFGVEFDHYGSTNSDENKQLCGEFWKSLREADLVVESDVEQLFDVEANTFLADRFVKGTCPKCGRLDQAGDNCECGHTYAPTDLIDPISVHTGSKPEVRTAKHLFVRLEELHEFLEEWSQSGDHLQSETANYLKGHFLNDELRDWDISRPGPYFGFEIPDSPGNFWYVWFDAPIGYIAATKQWCDNTGEDFEKWWKNETTEIHHFIGKDITYFHTLFWPGMLKVANFNLPTKVHIHGFLTVDGKKMAKRDGTFIKGETFLKYLDPEFLRYYYASKLGPKLDDIDLNFEEFIAKVNSDLVGKVVNLASRSAKFLQATGLSKEYPNDGGLFEMAANAGKDIAAAYENCDYNKAMRLILELADRANPFVENAEPWNLKKDATKADELQDVCTVAVNLFRQIVIFLSPVLPKLAEKAGELFGETLNSWDQSQTPLVGVPINKFKHMLKRADPKDIEKMTDETKAEFDAANAAEVNEDAPAATSGDTDANLLAEPLADEITIEDFVKIDLRIARIVQAEEVAEARKLLKLTVSMGGDNTRQVFAGIKKAYDPAKLVGRLVVIVANLKPRQMKFGLSEGMIAAAGPGGEDVFILSPDDGAEPGQRVH